MCFKPLFMQTYSLESIFSEQTKNIAGITFKIKIFGKKRDYILEIFSNFILYATQEDHE